MHDRYHIDHPHNEASALQILESRAIREHHGWDVAFWIACDERKAHRAIAALGHRAGEGDDAWDVVPLKGHRTADSSSKKTDDGEAMARAGSWIYLFGSHFGSKDGPLEPKRHFVARFNEALVECKKTKLRAEIEVARPPFLLHRVINEALLSSGLDLIARGEKERQDYIRATLAAADGAKKKWAGRITIRDWPINIEGAAFLPNGRLLIGLRFPVTAEGHPIVLEIEGIDRLFTGGEHGAPHVTRLWYLGNVGRPERPAGIRELDQYGARIHAVTGNLDSDLDESRVLQDHPEGREASSAHWAFRLPEDHELGIRADLVHEFRRSDAVEGVTLHPEDDTVWYVHDDERILLERAHL